MKHLLMAKGLWNLVDGSEVLTTKATATAAALFQLQLHKAFSTIGNGQCTALLGHLVRRT